MPRHLFLKKITVAVLALSGLAAFAQPNKKVELKPEELQVRAKELKLPPGQLKNIRAASQRLVAFGSEAVVQEFTGNFESVGKNFDTFSNEFKAQKLQAAANQPALLIILDDPSHGQFQYLVGYPVQAGVQPKAPLKLQRLQDAQAVRYTHTGSYEDLGNIHAGVKNSVKELHQKETKFPVTLRLLNDPRKVSPAERKTEIIVPVS
jgi:effector-binding domain-containing protein